MAVFARPFLRLNVIPFFVPAAPRSNRGHPILARHFLNEFSSAYGKKLANSAKAHSKFFFAIHGPAMCASCATGRAPRHRLPQIRIEPHHLPPELSVALSKVHTSPTHAS